MTDKPQPWCCNDCPTAIIIPPMFDAKGETTRAWVEAAIEVGKHRLMHFADRLTGASDEDILGMSEDEKPPLVAAAVVAEAERIVRRVR